MLVRTIFCVFSLIYGVLALEDVIPTSKENVLLSDTTRRDPLVPGFHASNEIISPTEIFVPVNNAPAVVIDQNASDASEVLCQNADFLAKLLNIILPMLAKNISGHTKTSYILSILKELIKSSPQSIQDDEVLDKINDLLKTLEKYDFSNINMLRTVNNNDEAIDSVKSKIAVKIEIPTFANPDCTTELLNIIKIVQDAITRLVDNPVCKTRVKTAVLPGYDVNSILVNPTKHLILQNMVQTTAVVPVESYRPEISPYVPNVPVEIYPVPQPIPQNLPSQDFIPSEQIAWPSSEKSILFNVPTNQPPEYVDEVVLPESQLDSSVVVIPKPPEDLSFVHPLDINSDKIIPLNLPDYPYYPTTSSPNVINLDSAPFIQETNWPEKYILIDNENVPNEGQLIQPKIIVPEINEIETNTPLVLNRDDTDDIDFKPISEEPTIRPYNIDNYPDVHFIHPQTDNPYHYEAAPTSVPNINGIPVFPEGKSPKIPSDSDLPYNVKPDDYYNYPKDLYPYDLVNEDINKPDFPLVVNFDNDQKPEYLHIPQVQPNTMLEIMDKIPEYVIHKPNKPEEINDIYNIKEENPVIENEFPWLNYDTNQKLPILYPRPVSKPIDNVELIASPTSEVVQTIPEQYETTHELPNWQKIDHNISPIDMVVPVSSSSLPSEKYIPLYVYDDKAISEPIKQDIVIPDDEDLPWLPYDNDQILKPFPVVTDNQKGDITKTNLKLPKLDIIDTEQPELNIPEEENIDEAKKIYPLYPVQPVSPKVIPWQPYLIQPDVQEGEIILTKPDQPEFEVIVPEEENYYPSNDQKYPWLPIDKQNILFPFQPEDQTGEIVINRPEQPELEVIPGKDNYYPIDKKKYWLPIEDKKPYLVQTDDQEGKIIMNRPEQQEFEVEWPEDNYFPVIKDKYYWLPKYNEQPNSQPIYPGPQNLPQPEVVPWIPNQPEFDVIAPENIYPVNEKKYWLPIDNKKPYPIKTDDKEGEIIINRPEQQEFEIEWPEDNLYPVINDKYPQLPKNYEEPSSQPIYPGPQNSPQPDVVPWIPDQPEFDVIAPESLYPVNEKKYPLLPINDKKPYPIQTDDREGAIIINRPEQQELEVEWREDNYYPIINDKYPWPPKYDEQPNPNPNLGPQNLPQPQVVPWISDQADFDVIAPENIYPVNEKQYPWLPIDYKNVLYPIQPEDETGDIVISRPEELEFDVTIPKEDNYYPINKKNHPWIPKYDKESSSQPNYPGIPVITEPEVAPWNPAQPVNEIILPDNQTDESNNVPDWWSQIYDQIYNRPNGQDIILDTPNPEYEIIVPESSPEVITEDVITEELQPSIDQIVANPELISSVPVITYPEVDQNILLLIKENIGLIEHKVPEILVNVDVINYLTNIKKLISFKTITMEDYVTILSQYEKLLDYIKTLNISNEILKKLLVTATKAEKSEQTIGKSNVIEFTYLVKRPKPLVYQPYYYVKYRLPYASFLARVKKLLVDKPYLKSDPANLYKELIELSNVAETSPDLKQYGKEGIHNLTYKNGTLLGAKMVKGEDKDMYATLNLLKDINSDSTLDDTIQLIKKAKTENDNIENDRALIDSANGNDNLKINIKVDNEEVEKKSQKMTSRDVINEVLKKVYNLRTNNNVSVDLDTDLVAEGEKVDSLVDNNAVISKESPQSVNLESIPNGDRDTSSEDLRKELVQVNIENAVPKVQPQSMGDKLINAKLQAHKYKTVDQPSLDYNDYSPLSPENDVEENLDFDNKDIQNNAELNKLTLSNTVNSNMNLQHNGMPMRTEYNNNPDSLQAKLMQATIDAQNRNINHFNNNMPGTTVYYQNPGIQTGQSISGNPIVTYQYNTQWGQPKVYRQKFQGPPIVHQQRYKYVIPGQIHYVQPVK